jgi:hypothetical protein
MPPVWVTDSRRLLISVVRRRRFSGEKELVTADCRVIRRAAPETTGGAALSCSVLVSLMHKDDRMILLVSTGFSNKKGDDLL